MDLRIEGRRAVVPAATAGLGFAAAASLATAGAKVAVCGRDPIRVEDAVARLPGEVIGLVADVATPAGAAGLVTRAAEALNGHVEILVANGGGPPTGDVLSTPLEAYSQALDQSLLAVVAMCQAVLPGMRKAGWGRILAITSISAREPLDFLVLSNTARAGVTGYLKTLATAVAQEGISVNSLQPGWHATQRVANLPTETRERFLRHVPAGRLGAPEDFGDVVAFLCSESAGFITGVSLPIDGGQSRHLL
jgi:3-oxoacyl-[acyl-carrier protein] reductase